MPSHWLKLADIEDGNRPDITAADADAAELSRIWEQQLRYSYRSAHTVVSAPDFVTMRAVTQIGPGDIWVTADIRVALA